MGLRRAGGALAVAVLATLLPVGRAAGGAVMSPNPVLRWDPALLAPLPETRAGPTVAARALAVLHTCMYDAWAAYDPVAVGTRLGGSLRRPPEERTVEAKAEAMSGAARLAAVDLFPQLASRFDAVLGDEPGSTGGPYSDWTGYRPVNGPEHVDDPDRWQPQPVPDGRGGMTVQQFVTPQWG